MSLGGSVAARPAVRRPTQVRSGLTTQTVVMPSDRSRELSSRRGTFVGASEDEVAFGASRMWNVHREAEGPSGTVHAPFHAAGRETPAYCSLASHMSRQGRRLTADIVAAASAGLDAGGPKAAVAIDYLALERPAWSSSLPGTRRTAMNPHSFGTSGSRHERASHEWVANASRGRCGEAQAAPVWRAVNCPICALVS
jgi:hypothetical protein